MGLFARWTNPKINPVETAELKRDLAILNRDARLHARVRLHDPSLGSLVLPNGGVGSIVDLSYGGIAAIFQSEVLKSVPATSLIGTLRLLGQEVQTKMSIVRVASRAAGPEHAIGGFCMHHETPAALLFLRDFIEPSRHGESMDSLALQHRHDRYQGAEWHCFRGEGPTDLILKTSPADIGQTPEEALLTFRMNEAYWELAFRNGKLKTGRVIGGVATATDPGAARMGSTVDLDLKILRSATFILAAAPTQCRALTAPILTQAKQVLLVASRSI